MAPWILVLWAGTASSAQSVSSFTATQYLKLALATSPEVRQADEAYHSADAAYDAQLAAQWLPTLSFSAQDYPYGDNPSNNYAFNRLRFNRRDVNDNATLNWNFFNSFQDEQRTRAARLSRESARRSLDAAKQDRAYAALQAYYDLSARTQLLAVADHSLQAEKQQYDQTLDLYRHGFKSLADLLKSETDWRSAELRRLQAESDRKGSLLTFNILVDRGPLEPAGIADDLDLGTAELPPLTADLDKALAGRPEVARARDDLAHSSILRQQAVQGFFPSLSANAAWNHQDTASFGLPSGNFGIPNPNYQVGLTLSLPVGYNVLSQIYGYLGARADERRARAALDAAARQVRLDVAGAYIALERATAAYTVAGRKEEITRRNLEIVSQQYKTGAADVIRLAQAQTDLLDAQVERTLDLHQILTDRVQYRRAVGAPLW